MCVKPMLAKIGKEDLLDRAGFIYEPKVDGIRATCEKNGGIRVFNRSCRDITARYPEFDFADAIGAETCILDGEIVLYNERGNPDFTGIMQRHLSVGRIHRLDRAIRYVVFDILEKDGRDLTALPLLERKVILKDTIGKHPHLELVIYTKEGHRLWDFIVKRNAEGVIAKKESSPYEKGRRSSSWIKIKAFNSIEAVIVGYTTEKKAVSALAVAAYAGDTLQFIGKVGIGIAERDVRILRDLLDPILIDRPPLAVPAGYKEIQWVEPRHVAEIKYLEFGRQGMLRNPIFMRLRPDKSPEECRLEEQLV